MLRLVHLRNEIPKMRGLSRFFASLQPKKVNQPFCGKSLSSQAIIQPNTISRKSSFNLHSPSRRFTNLTQSPSPQIEASAFMKSAQIGIQNTISSVVPTDVVAPVINYNGEVVTKFKLHWKVFGQPIRRDILQRVVVWQLANARQGSAKGKTRAEVSGSNRKPYKQKGTGHARVGTRRAPHFKGGGRAFPRIPRDFGFSLQKNI